MTIKFQSKLGAGREPKRFEAPNEFLDDLRNSVAGSVLAFDQRVALLSILTNKPTGLGIELHPVAHAYGLVTRVDTLGVQMLDRLLDKFFPAWMIPGRFDLLAKLSVIASLEADVGKVAPAG